MPVREGRILPEAVLRYLPRRLPGWIGLWALLVMAMTLAGAVAGGVLYPLVGSLLGMDLGLLEMVRNGVFDGGFYAFIWAPATGFVLCMIGVHEKKACSPKALDTRN